MSLQEEKTVPQVTVRQVSFARILLTGFRATGKSLVGQVLADRLGVEFLDTDALLCQQFGCSLADYVAEYGWARFRKMEECLLLNLCERSAVVIATGGGAVLHEQAWQSLRRQSVSVWLQADEHIIERRLTADVHSEHQRPSLTGMEPCLEIKELLFERTPLYLRGSDFGVRTDNCTPMELARKIEFLLPG